MKNLLTNFVVAASLASLGAVPGLAWAENTTAGGTVLPGSALQSPNTGPGTRDSVADTAHGVTPNNDVANGTSPVDPGNNAPAANPPPPRSDLTASALAKVHHVNRMEIEMAKLAMEKAESHAVRAYAERLLRDHQMSDRKLLSFADGKNIPVENFAVLTAEQQAKEREVSDQLHAVTGASFDRLYLQKMAEGHSEAINDITLAIEQLPDRAERNFLAKIRPIVGQHERLANILLSRKPS